MDNITINRSRGLRGEIFAPPDKSISHRAVFFSSISNGVTRVDNFLDAADPMSTVNAFRSLGVEIEKTGNSLLIHGAGLHGLREPSNVIDCGNSGTTIRLLTGLLCAQPFISVLTGDDSLRGRPMSRVIKPLSEMGARIWARDGGRCAPLSINGSRLDPFDYKMNISSAQVKTAIILAALYAEGKTIITQPSSSRDHTERMLGAAGAEIGIDGLRISITGLKELHAQDIYVPGDFSSAAFFIAAALLVKGSEITVKGVGVNPTRIGFINILNRMGVTIEFDNLREVSGEPIADLLCRYCGTLNGTNITAEDIPLMIDEFPILAVLATQAEGITEISGAAELRVKESDRIASMANELKAMGADVTEKPDGMIIKGPTPLNGAKVRSHHDHRIAMSLSVAGLIAGSPTKIHGSSCVDISFPGFYKILSEINV